MNVPVFDEIADAPLMIDYTGNKVQKRHAILALNKNGGGGIEFWQFKSRESLPPKNKLRPGDPGIFMLKMKVSNIHDAYDKISQTNAVIQYAITENVMDKKSFAFQDPFGNYVQLIESENWYKSKNISKQGGVYGVSIGVSNIEKSILFYSEILNFDVIGEIKQGSFDDLDKMSDGKFKYRRVILKHKKERTGPFAKLLGNNEIELIEVNGRETTPIFQDRYWGDQGFIHLCFDVQGMDHFKNFCELKRFEFTVDSSDSFDMGKAAGRFAYTEDPDGTLIEFVETHKIPILPKIGWYYKISKDHSKSLPDFLIFLMMLSEKN